MGRHWYRPDETGVFVPDHDLGIKDARAKGAYVSVTTVSKEVRATPYNLDRWKRQQLVKACVLNPRVPNETDESYYRRVDHASGEISREATDFGKAVHDACEKYPEHPRIESLRPWWEQFGLWHQQNVAEDLGIEEIVANHHIGVAGRLDRRVRLKDGRIAIVDIKTQGIKSRVYFGEDWPKQLSCYATTIRERDSLVETPACLNLVMNSNQADPVVPKEWTREQIEEAYQEFTVEAWLWSVMNNHWPVGQWSLKRCPQ